MASNLARYDHTDDSWLQDESTQRTLCDAFAFAVSGGVCLGLSYIIGYEVSSEFARITIAQERRIHMLAHSKPWETIGDSLKHTT